MNVTLAVNPAVRSTIKRLTDLTIAVFGLIFLVPLFAMIALLVYMSLGRPVIFRQVRVGYRRSPFTIYKFRTMRETRRADKGLLSDPDRITAVGRWLRKTSLDELPQLWNVLRGDLSLVGPRPQLAQCLASCTSEQSRRHEVRPGLTGLRKSMAGMRSNGTRGSDTTFGTWTTGHSCWMQESSF